MCNEAQTAPPPRGGPADPGRAGGSGRVADAQQGKHQLIPKLCVMLSAGVETRPAPPGVGSPVGETALHAVHIVDFNNGSQFRRQLRSAFAFVYSA